MNHPTGNQGKIYRQRRRGQAVITEAEPELTPRQEFHMNLFLARMTQHPRMQAGKKKRPPLKVTLADTEVLKLVAYPLVLLTNATQEETALVYVQKKPESVRKYVWASYNRIAEIKRYDSYVDYLVRLSTPLLQLAAPIFAEYYHFLYIQLTAAIANGENLANSNLHNFESEVEAATNAVFNPEASAGTRALAAHIKGMLEFKHHRNFFQAGSFFDKAIQFYDELLAQQMTGTPKWKFLHHYRNRACSGRAACFFQSNELSLLISFLRSAAVIEGINAVLTQNLIYPGIISSTLVRNSIQFAETELTYAAAPPTAERKEQLIQHMRDALSWMHKQFPNLIDPSKETITPGFSTKLSEDADLPWFREQIFVPYCHHQNNH